MERHGLETGNEGFDGLGAGEWFALGAGNVGARVVAAARIAAVLHEDLASGEDEGVGVLERLMLLEGAGIEDHAS